ncbi:MAG: TrkH family potassium uptake protein [Candidatus Anammoxibacter sp.]
MNIPLVLHVLGNLILLLAGIMLMPLGVAIYFGSSVEIQSFLLPIIAAGIIGFTMRFFTKDDTSSLGVREGFGIVTFGWLSCALFGAIPYWYSGLCPSFSNAYFESMSGFTTTGSTIFSNVEILPRSILFWRSLSQWLGGMGIIVFFVAFLPALKVGGYQLFSAEAPGPKTDKIKPRIAEAAKLLWYIYLSLTGLLIIFLLAGGMDTFDTICHAFSTVSTGGFSTKNASIAAFNSLYIEIVIMVFMFFSACNFVIHYQCVRGKIRKIINNSELRFFVYLLIGVVLIVTLFIFFAEPSSFNAKVKDKEYHTFLGSLRYVSFQVISLCTTTGYCSADFDRWPDFCRFMLVLLMLVGGCAGSTSGGMKNIRIILLVKYSLRELGHLIRPRVVKHVKIDKVSIDEGVIKNTLGFFCSYVGIFIVCFFILISLKMEVITAFSAVIASIGNIGPGLAGVGAVENYADIPVLGKWVLIFCMLVGRLEIFSILVMFLSVTWKR